MAQKTEVPSNGRRLIHALAQKRSPRKGKDRQAEKRKNAILEEVKTYYDKPKYIEKTCKYLQSKRVEMPQRWVADWNKDYSLGLVSWAWVSAYMRRECKQRIQNYISRHARLKLKSDKN